MNQSSLGIDTHYPSIICIYTQDQLDTASHFKELLALIVWKSDVSVEIPAGGTMYSRFIRSFGASGRGSLADDCWLMLSVGNAAAEFLTEGFGKIMTEIPEGKISSMTKRPAPGTAAKRIRNVHQHQHRKPSR